MNNKMLEKKCKKFLFYLDILRFYVIFGFMLLILFMIWFDVADWIKLWTGLSMIIILCTILRIKAQTLFYVAMLKKINNLKRLIQNISGDYNA